MKQNALRTTLLIVCGLLLAATVTFLALVFAQGPAEAVSASKPEPLPYEGPFLPEAESFRGVLVTGDDIGTTSDADAAGAALDTLLDRLAEIGCEDVVFDTMDGETALYGTDTRSAADTDVLSLLLERADARDLSVHALWHILPSDAVFSDAAVDAAEAEAADFAAKYGALAGIVCTDYTLTDDDALRDRYTDAILGVSFSYFKTQLEAWLLSRAQSACADAGMLPGTVADATSLVSPAFSSTANRYILLRSEDDAEAITTWYKYSRTCTDVPVYPFFVSPLSFNSLTATLDALDEAEVCPGGFLASGIPLEGVPEPPAASAPTEEDGDSVPSASESPEIVVTVPESEPSEADESGEPSEAPSESASESEEAVPEAETIEPAGSAHANTLALLAGLTDPADMTPIYPERDLLVDELILNRPLSKSGSGTLTAMIFTGVVPLGSVVTLDGEPVTLDEFGHFHHDVPLVMGYNIIYLNVNGTTYTYTYTRYSIDVTNYSPLSDAVVPGGTPIPVYMVARAGSVITVNLGGESTQLEASNNYGFTTYVGSLPTPKSSGEDVDLGKVTFSIRYNGTSSTVYGGAVTVQAENDVRRTVRLEGADNKYHDIDTTQTFPVTPHGAQAPDLADIDAHENAHWDYFPIANGAIDTVEYEVAYGGVWYCVLSSDVRVRRDDTVDITTPVSENRIISLTSANEGEFTDIVLDMSRAVSYKVAVTDDAVTFTFADTVSAPIDLVLTKTPLFTAAKWDGAVLTLPLRVSGGFLGYSARYDGARLTLAFTNPPESGSIVGARIIVDPGHGGYDTEEPDTGAFGAGLLDEAQFNWAIGSYLADYLTEIGAKPVVTPAETELLTIEQRMSYAYAHRAQMFLSIHHNAASYGSAYGVATYYFQDYSESLAQLVQNEVSALHDERIPVSDTHDNGIIQSRYMFTLRTGWLSLMLEDGFVCNGATYGQLVRSEFQASVALAITRAAATYYERFAPVANWPAGIESTLG